MRYLYPDKLRVASRLYAYMTVLIMACKLDAFSSLPKLPDDTVVKA